MLGACESDMEKIWVCDCLVNLEVQRPGALGMWCVPCLGGVTEA